MHALTNKRMTNQATSGQNHATHLTSVAPPHPPVLPFCLLLFTTLFSSINPTPLSSFSRQYEHSPVYGNTSFTQFHQCSLHLRSVAQSKMASEVVKVDELEFPKSVVPTASSKTLHLVGHGITDIEIHFLQIKFTAIGVYLDAEVVSHLQAWKGKSGSEILADDDFFDTLLGAPVDKFIRVVAIKELKGAQYGLQLENAVRDRLAAIDKFEEEEEEALEKLVEFFQGKYLKKNSLITYNFSASAKTVEVSFLSEGKEENKLAKTVVENENVAAMIKKWYLGGSSAVSQTTVTTLADGIAALLKQ